MNYRFLHPLAWVPASLLGMTSLELGAQTRHEFRELHMGGEVRIVLYAADVKAARAAARAAFDRMAQLEDVMSDYRPASEVRQLERHYGEWVRVSAELFDVLSRALEVARATNGAFDPTVGPLTALWRATRRSGVLPGQRTLDSARALADWRRVALDTAGRRVCLELDGMRLDLGGIAKGDIVHRALVTLRSRGAARALVEAGGDIALGDRPPGQPGWIIDVGDSSLTLANVSISTSGPQIQFVEIGGVRYSHIVDPKTGLGLRSARQATVIASDGALADALATAFTALDAERRSHVLAQYPGVRTLVQDRP